MPRVRKRPERQAGEMFKRFDSFLQSQASAPAGADADAAKAAPALRKEGPSMSAKQEQKREPPVSYTPKASRPAQPTSSAPAVKKEVAKAAESKVEQEPVNKKWQPGSGFAPKPSRPAQADAAPTAAAAKAAASSAPAVKKEEVAKAAESKGDGGTVRMVWRMGYYLNDVWQRGRYEQVTGSSVRAGPADAAPDVMALGAMTTARAGKGETKAASASEQGNLQQYARRETTTARAIESPIDKPAPPAAAAAKPAASSAPAEKKEVYKAAESKVVEEKTKVSRPAQADAALPAAADSNEARIGEGAASAESSLTVTQDRMVQDAPGRYSAAKWAQLRGLKAVGTAGFLQV